MWVCKVDSGVGQRAWGRAFARVTLSPSEESLPPEAVTLRLGQGKQFDPEFSVLLEVRAGVRSQ